MEEEPPIVREYRMPAGTAMYEAKFYPQTPNTSHRVGGDVGQNEKMLGTLPMNSPSENWPEKGARQSGGK